MKIAYNILLIIIVIAIAPQVFNYFPYPILMWIIYPLVIAGLGWNVVREIYKQLNN